MHRFQVDVLGSSALGKWSCDCQQAKCSPDKKISGFKATNKGEMTCYEVHLRNALSQTAMKKASGIMQFACFEGP